MNSFFNKILIAIISLILILLILFSINPLNQNCTNLCFYGNLTNNYFTGILRLNNILLKNSTITFILNNKLSEMYTIHQNGQILLYLPLSFGFNNLNINYNNYLIELHIFYLGGIVNFAILLIGILFYLIIKELTDFKVESYKTRIRYNYDIYYPKTECSNFYSSIKRAAKLSKNNKIIKNMAVKIDEIVKIIDKQNNNKKTKMFEENIQNELYSNVKFNKHYITNNMISTIKNPLKSIISRAIYEIAINKGGFKIDNNILKANNIILLDDLGKFNLLDLNKTNKINSNDIISTEINNINIFTIAFLSSYQNQKLFDFLINYNNKSALLLFLSLSKKVNMLAV